VGRNTKDTNEPGVGALLGDIVDRAETLLRQQGHLVASEARHELRKLAGAALPFGAGAGLLAAGGFLTAVATAHALHRATRLPLWACYGLAAGAAGAAGVRLLQAGRDQVARVQLPALPQTVEAFQENVRWLKEQVTSLPG
jgi:hypothetical protein